MCQDKERGIEVGQTPEGPCAGRVRPPGIPDSSRAQRGLEVQVGLGELPEGLKQEGSWLSSVLVSLKAWGTGIGGSTAGS